MAGFREAREALLYAFSDNVIDEEEFLLLYDLNRSKNRDFEYWIYDSFYLPDISDDDCKSEFRFEKNDIFRLRDVMQLTIEFTCHLYNE